MTSAKLKLYAHLEEGVNESITVILRVEVREGRLARGGSEALTHSLQPSRTVAEVCDAFAAAAAVKGCGGVRGTQLQAVVGGRPLAPGDRVGDVCEVRALRIHTRLLP